MQKIVIQPKNLSRVEQKIKKQLWSYELIFKQRIFGEISLWFKNASFLLIQIFAFDSSWKKGKGVQKFL